MDIIARCKQGDSQAWDALFDLHYSATARFVFQLNSDFTHEDVEEICQETFLAVIRNLERFQGQSQFQTWLFRIASNKARDYREKQCAAKRGGGHANLSLDAEEPETGKHLDPPSTAPQPDTALLAFEDAAGVRRALDQLGPPCQEVIQLRYFADLSYDEIAASLEINAKTVSSRLSKCLDKLEEILRSKFVAGEKQRFPV